MKCPHCLRRVRSNEAFCHSCGKPLPETERQGSSSVPKIIVIVVSVVLVVAAAVFLIVKFTAPQEGGREEERRNAVAATVSRLSEAELRARLSPLVESYEQAFNNSDSDAMTALFAPSLRKQNTIKGEALSFINDLAGKTGTVVTCDFALGEDVYYVDDDTAKGTVAVSVELPVVGKKSIDLAFTFQFENGEWYLGGIGVKSASAT